VLIQLLVNSLSLWGHFALLAVSFYFASVGCRHFNFATGLAFLAGPYVALQVQDLAGTWMALPTSLLCVGTLGYLYHKASIAAYRHGARQGQLLLISLAVLGISENLFSAIFGPGSQKLPLTVTGQEPIKITQSFFLITLSVIILIDIVWRRSIFGLSLQALNESRLNLRLRGFNVDAIERTTAILGFLLAGAAGILWSIDLRIRPAMGFEACLIGVVAFIVGPMLTTGPRGLILASMGIVLIRLPLILFFEGDWDLASPMILLVLASTLRPAKGLVRKRHAT
jgi:branched-subunit amino acid ABC-type transport system permease component